MRSTSADISGAWLRRFLGHDKIADLIHVVAMFAVFGVLDRLTLSLTALGASDLFASVLFVRAPLNSPLAASLLAVGLCGLAAVGRSRLGHSWTRLDHGHVLRSIGTTVVLWLAWRASAYDFNYVLSQWHAVDRALVLVLAIGCLWRPVFLLPFAIQFRLLNEQFAYPLDSRFGQNIDELLVMVLLAFAAAHMLYVATARRATAPALLIVATAIAAHFYVPGRAKLSLDWLATNDLSNLPFNGYTAGWGGEGNGQYAQRLGRIIATVNWPMKFGTLLVELGAVAAVAHHRLLRAWLPLAAGFHVLVFALTGYFLLEWVILEVALWLVVVRPSLRGWVDENSTPARGLGAMMAVVAGATLFHPPPLAWLDAPVGYGYEIEATGQSGRRYHVPLSAVTPFEQELAFLQVELSARQRAAGAYGAVANPHRLRDLQRLTRLEELEAFELTLGEASRKADSPSEQLMTSFVDHVNTGSGRPWFLVSPPPLLVWTRLAGV